MAMSWKSFMLLVVWELRSFKALPRILLVSLFLVPKVWSLICCIAAWIADSISCDGRWVLLLLVLLLLVPSVVVAWILAVAVSIAVWVVLSMVLVRWWWVVLLRVVKCCWNY